MHCALVWLVLVYGPDAESLASIPPKTLTQRELAKVYQGKIHLDSQAFSAVYANLRLPSSVALVEYAGLGRDLAQAAYRVERAGPGKCLALYYFTGPQPITPRNPCHENLECTITALWDGSQWQSVFSRREVLKGVNSTARKEKLLSQPNTITSGMQEGRIVITHTFPGSRVRRLVFNEAVLASGQLVQKKCVLGFGNCDYFVMDRFERVHQSYLMGIAGFSEERMRKGRRYRPYTQTTSLK